MTPPKSATAHAHNSADPAVAAVERPTPAGTNAPGFGSDIIADALSSLDIPYIALTPGASYRGLHDSIVNYLGNSKPQMLLCLHEEAAVAIAHGYAKVTGKAMVSAVHSNVGLMHATMAMFNAWCDRMPMVVLGATGPVDAVKRRPWIDWIHTARDQGALVREYTKWDDQPASPGAAREAILRGTWIANTVPQGPVYINFDAEVQEAKVSEPLPPIDVARYMPQISTAAPAEQVKQAAAMLKGAKQVLILAGRSSRDPEVWKARVALAEALNARVLSDLKIGASFPTDHPLYFGSPRAVTPEGLEGLKDVDVVLSLDWVDLAGALRWFGPSPSAKVIQISLDHRIHNGWSMDHQGLPPVDLLLSADPDLVVPELVKEIGTSTKPHAVPSPRKISDKEPPGFTNENIARALRKVLGDRPVTYTHLPLSWDDTWMPFRHPLDFVGSDGGGGVGGGPGISVGAALALKGTGRLPIAICGDGDFLMGVTAVWTAVHYKIPLLFVIANNRSFYNDELHQERMARARNRPVENKWIGQRMSDPDVDIAAMGRAQGAVGFGPVTKPGDLAGVLQKAIAEVDAGGVAVVDVRVEPGYTAVMTAAMTRAGS
ncbi:MAG TPA: thiamine pyrophosphate-dependent enzyme [Xanthobacteraceae bacterium]|jgi:thiamine pyrophosphate-dependent acetolactate synthase large subunit-like protein|nr:thiamine pyrophosphate-dependent enzyme [Xanthobacteraceae bacterium]